MSVWYEVSYCVHDSWADSESKESWDEAIERAEALAADMSEHTDTASWAIQILPHWCDGHQPCDCDDRRKRSEEEPFLEYRGITVDELVLQLENRLLDF